MKSIVLWIVGIIALVFFGIVIYQSFFQDWAPSNYDMESSITPIVKGQVFSPGEIRTEKITVSEKDKLNAKTISMRSNVLSPDGSQVCVMLSKDFSDSAFNVVEKGELIEHDGLIGGSKTVIVICDKAPNLAIIISQSTLDEKIDLANCSQEFLSLDEEKTACVISILE